MPKVKYNSNFSKITDGLAPLSQLEHSKNGNITVQQFFMIHNNFIRDKRLEGLAIRTIDDHIKLFHILKNYVIYEKRSI